MNEAERSSLDEALQSPTSARRCASEKSTLLVRHLELRREQGPSPGADPQPRTFAVTTSGYCCWATSAARADATSARGRDSRHDPEAAVRHRSYAATPLLTRAPIAAISLS
jgi:hypothetical protein